MLLHKSFEFLRGWVSTYASFNPWSWSFGGGVSLFIRDIATHKIHLHFHVDLLLGPVIATCSIRNPRLPSLR